MHALSDPNFNVVSHAARVHVTCISGLERPLPHCGQEPGHEAQGVCVCAIVSLMCAAILTLLNEREAPRHAVVL